MSANFPIIGLTGGIGSGKSVVSRILRTLAIPVYDCDSQAKRLTLASPAIRTQLVSLLGAEAYLNEGRQLNKKRMADFLFRSAENAKKINQIIHPVVRRDFELWAGQKKAQGYKCAAIESAILYESGFHTLASETWILTASEETRIQRISKRDSMTQEEALRRIDFQRRNQIKAFPPAAKIIENNPQNALLPQIISLLSTHTG